MDNTQKRILEAAKDLFGKYGLENVKMRDIAAECGISPGNLTYYFRKKEDLYAAFYKETLRADFEKLNAKSLPSGSDYPWVKYIAINYAHLQIIAATEKGAEEYLCATRYPSARMAYILINSELLYDCLKDTSYEKDRRSVFLAVVNGCGGEFETINTFNVRRGEYDFDEIISLTFMTRMFLLGVDADEMNRFLLLGIENGKKLLLSC